MTTNPIYFHARRTEVLKALGYLFTGPHLSPAVIEVAIHATSDELRRLDAMQLDAGDNVVQMDAARAGPRE